MSTTFLYPIHFKFQIFFKHSFSLKKTRAAFFVVVRVILDLVKAGVDRLYEVDERKLNICMIRDDASFLILRDSA